MENPSLRFYPGVEPLPPAPLARFLPPLPPGIVATWLMEHVPPGSWLLDPLGASPALALEAAQAGYRVLVASNNPILRFILETLAAAPRTAELQSALAELAASRRGEERLEQNIQSLYLTPCDSCAEQVPAQSFLWRKGETQPFARVYNCPQCGESGEHPITPADLARLTSLGSDRLQRSRALQRVILNEDDQRSDVEEALENYLPRALYVLFTLLNKIEGLGLPPARARLLHALLLNVFDEGSALWPYPGGRSRPKQLNIPPTFRENNLWLALEESARLWTAAGVTRPVRVTYWPDLPDEVPLKAGEGAICLYRGRVKALMPLPESIDLRAALTVFPRPNQAFWTLSVLWAGWLWGAEAALPLRNVLDRRRYDWNWHTSAIHSALAPVAGDLPPETPFFGILPELVPGFLNAVTVASAAAGFELRGLALRSEQELAEGLWQPGPPRPVPGEGPTPAALEHATAEAMRADLLERAEPAPYLVEYAAGLAALVRSGGVPRSLSSIPGDLLTRAHTLLQHTFADRAALRVYNPQRSARLESGPLDEERGAWWLANDPAPAEIPGERLPLADRVEMEVVRFMQRHSTFTFAELDQSLCAIFRGLLTPPVELLRACLDSYGESIAGQPGAYRMRTSEMATARKADLQEMQAAIASVGRKLGYATQAQGSPLVWVQDGTPAWWFFCMASSILSRYVLVPLPGPAERCVLVLPGGRARLLSYKLRRDPRLADACQGWRFLKFRHLREIAAGEVTAAGWVTLLGADPLTDEATQMSLFSAQRD